MATAHEIVLPLTTADLEADTDYLVFPALEKFTASPADGRPWGCYRIGEMGIKPGDEIVLTSRDGDHFYARAGDTGRTVRIDLG